MKDNKRALTLYFLLIVCAALGNGLSDSVYGNYFKDAYGVTAFQRGLIEFPRELPGALCGLAVAGLAFLGDIRLCLIAQILSFAGLTALGMLTPPFAGMLVFLFINSFGMHLFMPLQDAVGMELAEKNRVGARLGQYASVKSAAGLLAGLAAFFGFRYGVFSFLTPIKGVFLAGAGFFLMAILFALLLVREVKPPYAPKRRFRLLFRKEYKYYYALTVLHGVQKQIAFVYGSWVIIDLMGRGADDMSMLTLVASFLCIFFMNLLGKWMDKYGIKKMMYLDALTFIGVYVIYGAFVALIQGGALPATGFAGIAIFVLFILDRLSMQIGVVKSLYLKRIALCPEDVTATLSTGISLDHVVSIIAAALGGLVWTYFGAQWVFFIAAALSLGNLYVASRIREPSKGEAI